MTLIEKLQAALKLAGLSEGLANVINVTEESQIAGIVAQLKGGDNEPTPISPEQFLQSDAMTAYIAENGFDKVLKLNKGLQSEHDKKVNAGINTFKQKALGTKTQAEIDAETGKAPLNATPPTEAPEWFKPFAEQVSQLANAKKTETKMEQAQAAMAKSSLPQAIKNSWINRINLESEVPFEEQVTALNEEYKTIHKGIVGEGSYEFNPEEKKPSNGTLSQKDLAELKQVAVDL